MTTKLRARSGTLLTLAATERRYHLVCAVAAVAQLVTLRWTWDLWSNRSAPPNLPVVEALSSVSWGPLLVVLCIATAVVPKWGGPAFGIALALASLRRLELVCVAVECDRGRRCTAVVPLAARGRRVPEPAHHCRCSRAARLPRPLLRWRRRRVHQPQPVLGQHSIHQDLRGWEVLRRRLRHVG
jgi:hypothetical protein